MSYLRQVKGMLSQGKTLEEACQEIGVSEHIYYRWTKMDSDRRLQKLERENADLKRVIANQGTGIEFSNA